MRVDRKTEILAQQFLLDRGRTVLLKSDLLGSHARNLCNLLLQTTHSGLMGILVDDPCHRHLVNLQL